MFVQNELWRKLSDILNSQETVNADNRTPQRDRVPVPDTIYAHASEQVTKASYKAQKEWFGAIAALQRLLLASFHSSPSEAIQGLILSSPAPVVNHADLMAQFRTGVFSSQASRTPALMPCQSSRERASFHLEIDAIAELPLLPNDPLASEQFCLALTPQFGLLMVLGEDSTGISAFQFSFEPETIQQAWSILRSRLLLVKHYQLHELDLLVEQFSPPVPSYRLVTEFTRLLLKHLPEFPALETKKSFSQENDNQINKNIFPFAHLKSRSLNRESPTDSADIELLQALTHEIRTPLTTIRTMTRLLLKRSRDLTPEIVKRLETIDQECTEQINRMELIFRAVEFKTAPVREKQVNLVSIALEQVLQQSIPCWQKQAQRRNVELDVVLPKKLPQVVSDPDMLDRVLSGLMEKFIRSLPTGGQIQVRVTTAGSQLKLQFYTQSVYQDKALKALGQLLMFQPETGSLSLNMDVTKNLFNALGGKLIVRQRPQQGEVLTVFLPLGNERSPGR